MADQPLNLTFEQAAARAEEIVRLLEGDPLPLAEGLALYQEGQAMLAHCEALLQQAKLQITQLQPPSLAQE